VPPGLLLLLVPLVAALALVVMLAAEPAQAPVLLRLRELQQQPGGSQQGRQHLPPQQGSRAQLWLPVAHDASLRPLLLQAHGRMPAHAPLRWRRRGDAAAAAPAAVLLRSMRARRPAAPAAPAGAAAAAAAARMATAAAAHRCLQRGVRRARPLVPSSPLMLPPPAHLAAQDCSAAHPPATRRLRQTQQTLLPAHACVLVLLPSALPLLLPSSPLLASL
jgi:hypothetical protein